MWPIWTWPACAGRSTTAIRWAVHGFCREKDVEYVLVNDSYADSDDQAPRRYRLDQFLEAWQGRVAYIVHPKQKHGGWAAPQRVPAQLTATGEVGSYLFEVKGHQQPLSANFSGLEGGTLAYTIQDGVAYAACRDTLFRWDRKGKHFRAVGTTGQGQRVTCLYADGARGLWVGTTSGLFYVDDPADMQRAVCAIPRMNVLSVYLDSRKRLWVAAYRDGMCRLERQTDGQLAIDYGIKTSSRDVRCFVEDGEGNVWVGTFNGLDRIAPDGTVTRYQPGDDPGSLSYPSVFSLYRDAHGGIWVGTFYGGVNYFHPDANAYTHYSEHNALSYPYVGKMVEDNRGDIWI